MNIFMFNVMKLNKLKFNDDLYIFATNHRIPNSTPKYPPKSLLREKNKVTILNL